jgi:UDP-N-acetylmuramate-alanine ligase
MTSPLLDASDARPVHFIGIAGAGMSALAELLKRRGINVAGTDANPGGAPDLAAMGIAVSAHDAALVANARAVVYSSAIPATHPEMEAARRLQLRSFVVRKRWPMQSAAERWSESRALTARPPRPS